MKKLSKIKELYPVPRSEKKKKMELEKLFWEIDDFFQEFIPIFEQRMIPHKIKKNKKETSMIFQ